MHIAFKHVLFTSLFLALCLGLAPNASADTYVLTFDGQKIDVNSLHAVTSPEGATDILQFNFDVGKYTTQFVEDLAKGTRIAQMDVDVYLDGALNPYEKIVLTNDFIRSITINPGTPAGIITEDVDFEFASISYQQGVDSGGTGGTGGTGGAVPTPEPSALALLSAGLAGLVIFTVCKKH